MLKVPVCIKQYFDLEWYRDLFVKEALEALPEGSSILDAGCGSQRYRKYCDKLAYFSQDFGEYKTDLKDGFTSGAGGKSGYKYGEIDYLGNIWDIPVQNGAFDAVLCTEVLEHVPYPTETVKELTRLLKINGKLILTVPSNSLRHMDPYYFFSGFSDNWIVKICQDNCLRVDKIQPVGDYYKWMAIELGRAAWHHGILAKIMLTPSFIYFFLKKASDKSINTMCLGYYMVATKE